MPTLNWIGKEAVVNHHHQVPFRTLEKKYTFGDTDSDNMIIHGDNLEALKALLPKYEGRIKCIYIDPPYNTGAKPDEGGWVYYDNVDSPKIRKWLGQVVGPEFEDLSRHDKWLCMMYPRLKLLYQLLSNDGVLFVSIDNNEMHNLKYLLDDIFSAANFVTMFAVENNPKGRKNNAFVSEGYEYCFLYCRDKEYLMEKNKPSKRCFNDVISDKKDTRDMLKDEYGIFKQSKRQVSGCNKSNELCINSKEDRCFTIYYNNSTDEIKLLNEYNRNEDAWFVSEEGEHLLNNGYTRYICSNTLNNKPSIPLYTKETLIQKHEEHSLYFKDDGTIYEKDRSEAQQITSFLPNKRFADLMTETATSMLENIFGEKDRFTNSKNVNFVSLLISLIKDKDFVILDSFAGSGTTAHAVLNLNKQDGGNRKFILVEMEDYAEDITAERVKRVINGYGKEENAVEGTGSGFSFYELGEMVFNADGYLNEAVGVEKIREYIWYSETHVPYNGASLQYLLGNHNGTAYYFYYEPNHITTLNHDTLNIVCEKAETYVIYADQCMIDDEWLTANHIIFKKIPRDINKF